MWTIKRIDEADFGCEERLPGGLLMVLVCDDGRMLQLEVADNWLTMQELDEGDEWPDDPDEPDEEDAKSAKQVQWMESYLDALEEVYIPGSVKVIGDYAFYSCEHLKIIRISTKPPYHKRYWRFLCVWNYFLPYTLG